MVSFVHRNGTFFRLPFDIANSYLNCGQDSATCAFTDTEFRSKSNSHNSPDQGGRPGGAIQAADATTHVAAWLDTQVSAKRQNSRLLLENLKVRMTSAVAFQSAM
ncbi:MAG: hypothetical protein JJ979_25405 [Roseibium sp.]|nr:hypothetical protein [Roseibium sp.]